MGRASNPARIVEVEGVVYYWRASPDILTMVVEVWPRNLAGARMTSRLPISRVIAPRMIRQIIELARAHGYDPRDAKAAALVVELAPPSVRRTE